MRRYRAHLFSDLAFHLGQMHQLTKEATGENGPSPGSVECLRQAMRSVKTDCGELGMRLSASHIETLDGLLIKALSDAIFLASGEGWPHVNRHIFDVHGRLRDELKQIVLFSLEDGRDQYFADCLFGAEVGAKFSDAAFDISEAGKCLALSRFTACVFHLMRVLELGLQSLAAVFSIPTDNKNWGAALRDLEAAVKNMEKDAAWVARADWRDQREIYAQAIAQFSVFRDAWRNHVAHNRRTYTEEQARDVFGAVRAFMQALATRLEQTA